MLSRFPSPKLIKPNQANSSTSSEDADVVQWLWNTWTSFTSFVTILEILVVQWTKYSWTISFWGNELCLNWPWAHLLLVFSFHPRWLIRDFVLDKNKEITLKRNSAKATCVYFCRLASPSLFSRDEPGLSRAKVFLWQFTGSSWGHPSDFWGIPQL